MNALDVGACTWLPDASSRWPGRGENKAHGCFDRVTKSTKTREQKKKKKASLTAQVIRSTRPPRYGTLWLEKCIPESGWWLNISSKSYWNGVWEEGTKQSKIIIIKRFPLCRKGSCYLSTGYYWDFPLWRVLPLGSFERMCCLLHVGVNIHFSVGLWTSSSANHQECQGL